jgi:glucoamylase
LRVQLPQGPCWYRYNGDGYGEHEDGSPFDGSGIGRPWPLLAGERAHYELAAGRRSEAESLLTVMEQSTAGHGRLLPEQVWDADDIPALELFRGKPSGSACPLVWAHSEYIKFAAPCATARFSISLRKPCNAIWSRSVLAKSSAGD